MVSVIVWVWQGKGLIVPISFIGLLLLYIIFSTEANIPLVQTGAPSFAFILTGLICYIFGNKWRKLPGRIVFDKSINEEIEIKEKNTFFWIDVFHWTFICVAFGLLCLISLFLYSTV